MKAIARTSVALVLVSFPALAGHGKHAHRTSRSPTAMHSVQVHFKDASIPRGSDKKPVERQREREQAQERGTKRARPHAHAKAKPKPPCLHEAVTIARGTESDKFPLTRCDGEPAPDAVEMLSVLGRPGSAPRPAHGAKVAHLRRLDVGLVERLQRVADHFGHGHGVSMHIVSGYRPESVGSYHAKAQALDFRVDGVTNEKLVAYCKTLPDTGCGYYPNSTFVHLDVRPPGTGHVAWIDASGPGEKAHYVAEWPPPPEVGDEVAAGGPKGRMKDPPKGDFAERLAKILPPLPIDEHPASVVGAEAARAAM